MRGITGHRRSLPLGGFCLCEEKGHRPTARGISRYVLILREQNEQIKHFLKSIFIMTETKQNTTLDMDNVKPETKYHLTCGMF